jgi:hypothetical protein
MRGRRRRRSTRARRWGIGAIGALFLLVGVLALVRFAAELRAARQMRERPTASGTILSARLEDYDYMESRGRGSRRRTGQRARIEYEYTVPAQAGASGESLRLTSTRVLPRGSDPGAEEQWRVGGAWVGRRKSQYGPELIERYAEGKQVLVWYDPDNPRDAALEVGVPELRTLFFVGIGFGGLGLLLLALAAFERED